MPSATIHPCVVGNQLRRPIYRHFFTLSWWNVTPRKYTVQQLIDAVKTARSIRQVLFSIGLVPAGGNYATVHAQIAANKLDTAHFRGQGWMRGNTSKRIPIEDYLSGKVKCCSHHLRKRLLQENVFEHICAKCHNTRWNGNQIPLELDHINGNHDDNRLGNLRLLCPNCHAQTPTYRGRNIGKRTYR